MKGVTRERPKIDRIACPWLIARFIDKSPHRRCEGAAQDKTAHTAAIDLRRKLPDPQALPPSLPPPSEEPR